MAGADKTQPNEPYAGASGDLAVLFADIAGSTKLYEALGDTQAKILIDEALGGMRAITERHRGSVIKTIGDELMCVFPDAERGFLAAMDMQLLVHALPVAKSVKRMIRIGFHFGAVIVEKGDVFGDTVNLAARMAGLAKGMQIMTTRTTVDALPAALRASTRQIAALPSRARPTTSRCAKCSGRKATTSRWPPGRCRRPRSGSSLRCGTERRS